MSTHWHDTPLFDRVRDARVAACRATDEDEAENVCGHLARRHDVDESDFYFMRGPRTGEGSFMCKDCCEKNVALELACLEEPPADAVAAAGG